MPLPEAVAPPTEDNEELAELTEAFTKESNKWTDMGYAQLR
jgi:hypothetical protein